MNKAVVTYIALAIVLLVAEGCRKVPDYVIAPDDMAELMADLHVGEAVVEANFGNYPTDSARMLLKQSILAKHGVTPEQLDTSFMWYGAHLDIYDRVNDRTIEILGDRIAEAGTGKVSAGKTEAITGDSVNLWTRPAFMIVKPTSPSRRLVFEFPAGNDWKQGDMFTIRGKFSNVNGYPAWTMSAAYSDGSIEVLTTRFSGDGWHEMTFFADSLKTLTGINGSIDLNINRMPMVVDSLSLVRKPLVPRLYPQRYRQRAYNYFNIKHKDNSGEVVEP